MTSSTFDRVPGIGPDRAGVDRDTTRAGLADRPRRAKADGEGRGPLWILVACLFTLAWIVLIRDTRIGMPGSMPAARGGTQEAAGQALEDQGRDGLRNPPGIQGRGSRGVAEPPR